MPRPWSGGICICLHNNSSSSRNCCVQWNTLSTVISLSSPPVCVSTAGDAPSTTNNNKAETAAGQPPSELFRSGELSFGTFGDEPAAEVGD